MDGRTVGQTASGWMCKWMDKSRDGLREKKNIVAKAIMVKEFSLW